MLKRTPFVKRHGFAPGSKSYRTAACWFLAALFASPMYARPGGGVQPAASFGGRQGVLISHPAPPALPGTTGSLRQGDSQIGVLNRQYQLERLANAAPKVFDIVPPNAPDLAANSPLPGYRLIRLGRKHNNRLCFAATVADTKGLMMLDTGVTNTALNESRYRSLRLGAIARLPTGIPHDLNLNGVHVSVVEAPDFQVGPSNLGAVPVCLIKREYLQDVGSDKGLGQSYDGLFGQNILRHYRAMIDCARLVLYLNLDPAKKLDLAASFARHGWTRIPMIDTGSHFLVPCVLNGRQFRLVVDTGAPFTNLDRALLKDAQVPTHALPLRGNLIGMQSEQVSLVDVDRIQIGGYVATDVHMTATDQSLAAFAGAGGDASGGPVVGLLGGDLLAKHGAIIDIGNRALYLKPASLPATPSRRLKP